MSKQLCITISDYAHDTIFAGWSAGKSERIESLALLGIETEVDRMGELRSKVLEASAALREKDLIIKDLKRAIEKLKSANSDLKNSKDDKKKVIIRC